MRICIWGSGYFGTKLKKIIEHNNHNHIDVLCFVDNDRRKTGECYLGVPVIEPGELVYEQENIDAVVIAVSNENVETIVRQASELGIKKIYMLPEWQYAKGFGADLSLVRIDTEKPRLPYLEIHASEHCNLNCKGCASFCGMIKTPAFVDVDSLNKDMDRLKELVWGVAVFRIMGGEPLLNPGISEVITCVRNKFPDAELHVGTNGLLFSEINEAFLQTMKENGAILDVGRYAPTERYLPEIRSVCELYGIRYGITKPIEEFVKQLNSNNTNNPTEAFNNCVAQGCTVLSNGIITRCVYIQYADLLNRNFGTNYDRGEDYVDIYDEKIESWEMVKKLYEPGEFCRYCLEKPTAFKWKAIGHNYKKEDWIAQESFGDGEIE